MYETPDHPIVAQLMRDGEIYNPPYRRHSWDEEDAVLEEEEV